MATGDVYRAKAAEFQISAQNETHPAVREELERLAQSYLRLAQQADRNDLSYESPPDGAGQRA